jgi:phosphoribosylformylglycinamidine synthase
MERVRFVRNTSGRFESRFLTVSIEDSPAVMLDGMAGTSIGVWVAHGEGRVYFPAEAESHVNEKQNLAPIRYADDTGAPTEAYPFNPNGSPGGIAAICSSDGRHLAMMPHPERTFLPWQWGWMPEGWKAGLETSPWLKMFQNARDWCEKQV